MIINMVLASFTFFTTQKNSSFFFEYILVTSVTCLLPNVYITTYFRNTAVNLLAVAIVFHLLDYPVSATRFYRSHHPSYHLRFRKLGAVYFVRPL